MSKFEARARDLFPNAIRKGPEMEIAPSAETFTTIDNGGLPFKIDEDAGGVTLTVRVFASSVEKGEDEDVYPQLVGTWRNIEPRGVLRGRHRERYQPPHKYAPRPDLPATPRVCSSASIQPHGATFLWASGFASSRCPSLPWRSMA